MKPRSCVAVLAVVLGACASRPGPDPVQAYQPAPWFPVEGSEGEARMAQAFNRHGGASYRVQDPQFGELEVMTDAEGQIVGVRRLGR